MTRRKKIDDELDAYREDAGDEPDTTDDVSFILRNQTKEVIVRGVDNKDITTPLQVNFAVMYGGKPAGTYIHSDEPLITAEVKDL